MKACKGSKLCSVLMLFLTLGCAACATSSSDAYAGGVHFGFGVDVPIPGSSVPPPAVVYPPPVVVEQVPVPPPVVVKRTPPPPVVYEGPVVVEKRTTLYYYAPTNDYRTRHEETEREYYRQRSRSWDDNELY